jgi:hypothetical protein
VTAADGFPFGLDFAFGFLDAFAASLEGFQWSSFLEI